ncbi:MAG TPA: hypothetical protein VK471_07135 [Solirubrobacterales bacterium]|nr:hypothetical protein [Solirubrobacterales bacterium]
MRGRLRSWLAMLGAAVALTALCSGALAYFSGGGAGVASAAVTTLVPPTITAANPAAGGTVALSWSAVTPPGAGTVTYYVKRDGGAPAGNCPAQAAPQAITSCTDSGLAVGTYEYTVSARFRSWTATSAVASAKVTVGPAARFAIAGAPTNPAAGGAVNLTITAQDTGGNTVTTYTGSHSLVFSGASASPGGNAPTVADSSGAAVAFGQPTALSFASGVATVSKSKNGVLTIYLAGVASITASEGSLTTPTPLALTVSPGSASKYGLAAATTTPAAGAADNLTITAQDAFGNTATSYTGSHSLTFSGASASPGGNAPTVSNSAGTDVAFGTATAINFSAGVATVSGAANGAMKLYKSGGASITATDGSLTNPTALALTVSAGAATKLLLAAATTTPVAAAADNLTITAQDAFGNTATSYTGSKNLTFAGAEASPSGAAPTVANKDGAAVAFGSPTTLTFTSGVASVSASKNGVLILNKVGAANVTATDGTFTTAPVAFTVSTGAAARVAVTNVALSAGSAGSPCFFTCAVTGLGNSGTLKANVAITDSAGNTVSAIGAGKSATITSTGGTIAGSPLALPATGPAVSAAQFTYTAPASGSFNNTITVAVTGFTSATVTAKK